MTSEPLLKIDDLSIEYRGRRGNVQALQNVDLEVAAGRTTAIVGESGSGKTTLARAVIGLLPGAATLTSGSVSLEGRDLTSLSRKEWFSVRGQKIGWVPQDPTTSLNPLKTIGGTVTEALQIHGWGNRQARTQRALELLGRVGIDDPELRASQYPHELSGGMRQRVLIAAALALDPALLIADEPTSALDVTVQKRILDLIDELKVQIGCTVLLITHDLSVAAERADHVVVMEQGHIREQGQALKVLTEPKHAYTRQLMADVPSFATAPPAQAPRSEKTLLKVRNLRQEFTGRGGQPFVAVDDVSFDVQEGSTHGIVGESGSGKTTIGRAITMFREPTGGTIELDGVSLLGLSEKEKRRLRPDVQLVHQNPQSSLDPRQRINSIISEPLRNYHVGSKEQIRQRVAKMLDLVGLPSTVGDRGPRELSGGQLQRVAIARALVLEPKLLVFDEAVSALDVTVQAQILRLLATLKQELNLSYVFISHDLAVIRQIAQTVSVLHRGRQVESGTTEQVLLSPQDEYTRALLDAVPKPLESVPTGLVSPEDPAAFPRELVVAL